MGDVAVLTTGVFEPNGRTGGYLRSADANYKVQPGDIVVTPQLTQELRLRGGETIVGTIRAGGGHRGRGGALNEVESVNARSVDAVLG